MNWESFSILADNAGGCFDPSNHLFAFATSGEARLYNLASGKVLRRWPLASGLSDQVQYDARGRLLVLRREWPSRDRQVVWRLFELGQSETPVLLHEQTETDWVAQDLALAPGGQRFLVGNTGPDGTRRVLRGYDVLSGQEICRDVTARTNGDFRVYFDPTGRWFAYNSKAGPGMRLMDSASFKEVADCPGLVLQAVSPSGLEFASTSYLLMDRRGGVIPFPRDWVSADSLSFSSSGKLVAFGTEAGTVFVAQLDEVKRRLASLGP